ncbi:MAG: glutaminase A [Nesterenkonia sp.]|nr:glutaminase A [Nesterenkonia sp.]
MRSPIQQHLEELHAEIQGHREGSPYMVHPVGREPDPEDFGICLATVDGHVYSVGVADEEFSIHSISKPFTYALALSDHGSEAVDAKVDVEPSGDRFNEISLAPETGRPANSMINAGALAVASMIKGSGGKSAQRRIYETYSRFAGRRLSSSPAVYDVEIRSSDRNHALAYLLSSFGIIDDDPTRALELYLRQCAVQVTCRDLAMMAATLAGGGTHPLTGERAVDFGCVERVLSVMMTSGMYDDAGAWVADVGMPAKSGVGGGTLAVLPGQAGLAVYSPPLDAHGSSIRGLEVCRRLSKDMEMHFVRAAPSGRAAVVPSSAVVEMPSRIRRTDAQDEVLDRFHELVRIVEVTGDLFFAGAESLVRTVSDLEDEVEIIVVDLRQVNDVGDLALQMIAALVDRAEAEGRTLALVDSRGVLAGSALIEDRGLPTFPSRGPAVEFCEDRLLHARGQRIEEPVRVPVVDSPVLADLSEDDRHRLSRYLEDQDYADGDIIRRVGQRFGGVHFIVSGRVNTIAADPEGNRVRLNTLSAGMTFGELALGSEDRQETTEKAVGDVEVAVLTPQRLDDLESEDPQLAVRLWRALTRDAYLLVDRYLRESAVRVDY